MIKYNLKNKLEFDSLDNDYNKNVAILKFRYNNIPCILKLTSNQITKLVDIILKEDGK